MKNQGKTRSMTDKANQKSTSPSTTKKSTVIERFIKHEPTTEGMVKNEGFVENLHHLFATSGKQKTLQDLFKESLINTYDAEMQLADFLPRMSRASATSDLKKIFTRYYDQTKKQVKDLHGIMENLRIEESGRRSRPMMTLLDEAEEVIKNFPSGLVRDSALVIAAQKIEHYEIACYNSLCELAEVLGLNSIYDELSNVLEEEMQTNEIFTSTGKDINEEACES